VEVSLKRDLSLLEVLMIGVGPNIGSTIFVLVGFGVSIAGPALILALVLNFVITLFTAFSYAELSSAFPETGGGYLWIKKGLFPPFGFLGGWMSWVGHCIACGVYVLGFGAGITWILDKYHLDLFGMPDEIVVKVFAVLIAVAFSYLNYKGVKGTGRSEIYVSIVLIIIVVTFILFALAAIFAGPDPGGQYEPFMPFGLAGEEHSQGDVSLCDHLHHPLRGHHGSDDRRIGVGERGLLGGGCAGPHLRECRARPGLRAHSHRYGHRLDSGGQLGHLLLLKGLVRHGSGR